MKVFLKKIIVFLLILEAKLVLKRHKPKIVAVTGSVGKTTTKDAIYSVLKNKFFVRKSEKSYNSEIGVPLAIIGCPNAWTSITGWLSNIVKGLSVIFLKRPYPDILILEVGADRPGDIEEIAKWLRPEIAVITRLAKVPVHVEFFSSPEAVADEKLSLVRESSPSGSAIFCSDDEILRSRPEFSLKKTISFGFDEGALVRGDEYKIVYENDGKPTGISFKVSHAGLSVDVGFSGAIGNQSIYALLSASAVGLALGMTLDEIASGLKEFSSPPGRMRLISGIGDSIIIDDTYNSSPIASSVALSTFSSMETVGRKIVVFGDMLELGKYSIEEHKSLGRQAVFADKLVVVGVRARDIAAGAREVKMPLSKIKFFETALETGDYLKSELKKGDAVLVKGSQGMRMERVVKALMSEPDRAEELLVRQDEEWARR